METLTRPEAIRFYRKYRAQASIGTKAFEARCRARLPADPTHEDWAIAAEQVAAKAIADDKYARSMSRNDNS